MKHRLIVAMVALGAWCVPALASAQIGISNCGTLDRGNWMQQYAGLAAVQVVGWTLRSPTPCSLEVQAEAWVWGYGRAGTDRGLYFAEANIIVPVPSGTYTGASKHWLIWNGQLWTYYGTLPAGPATVTVEKPSRRETCEANGGVWNGNRCTYSNCPIIGDLANDGYRLTSAHEGVFFDLTADGVPEQVAWTEAGSDDAFLVLDRNGNGRVDDGGELFGDHTPAYLDEAAPLAHDGFQALFLTEGPSYGPAKADGVIDQQDAVWFGLQWWKDGNHNGISEPNELSPVADSELLSISTDAKLTRRRDANGNEFRLQASSTWLVADKKKEKVEARHIYDVWLVTPPQ